MQQYTLAVIFFGVVAFVTVSTSASVISCTPNNLQDASPKIRQLCFAIEQAMSENGIYSDQDTEAGRLVRDNTKRQDVDHVFLRFGRRF